MHQEHVISPSAMEQIENFQAKPGDHKWGETFLFDIQIEVPNPQSLWHLAKEENAVMLQLSKEFADTLFFQLNELTKVLGSSSIQLWTKERFYLKGFHEQEGRKAHHCATLVVTFGVFERFLPALDEYFQDDLMELTHPAWKLTDDFSTAQVVWHNRSRSLEYVVQVQSDTPQLMTPEDMTDLLTEANLQPSDVKDSHYEGLEANFNSKDYYATIPTDTFQKVIKKECMHRGKNVKLLLTWKPRGVLSAQARIGQAKAAFANCATTANIIPGPKSFKEAVMNSTYKLYKMSPEEYPVFGQEPGPRNVPTYKPSPQEAQDGGWQEVPVRNPHSKRYRHDGAEERDYRLHTSRPVSPKPQSQVPMTQ